MKKYRGITIAISFLLLIVAVFAIKKPETKIQPPEVTADASRKVMPEESTTAYELSSAQKKPLPSSSEDMSAKNQSRQKETEETHNMTAKKVVDDAYDSVDPSLPPQDLATPPPEESHRMQQKGVVIF